MEEQACHDVVEALQVAGARRVLAQRVQNQGEGLAGVAISAGEEGLLRVGSWDIKGDLSLVGRLFRLALDALVDKLTLLVVHR